LRWTYTKYLNNNLLKSLNIGTSLFWLLLSLCVVSKCNLKHNNYQYKEMWQMWRQTHASQQTAIAFTVADKMSLQHKETIMEGIVCIITQRIAQTVTVHILQEWISVFVDYMRTIAAHNYISFASIKESVALERDILIYHFSRD